ncbi:MAG: hypothetical protein ACYCPA_00735 [Acidithiobacillus sp.]
MGLGNMGADMGASYRFPPGAWGVGVKAYTRPDGSSGTLNRIEKGIDMSLEEQKIRGLLNSLTSAELLFISQKKAVLVLGGIGANGPKAKGCFEVNLCLDHDGAAVLSATVHGVTPFKPGYVGLDGRHDLDGGHLFSTLSNGWMEWWAAECDLTFKEFNAQEQHEMTLEKWAV